MDRNFGSSRNNDEEMRIVMVGKTGVGKSATGNTILGRRCFESKFSGKSITVECSRGKTTVDGQQVAVIDTPGLFDTRFGMDKTTKDMTQCISYASPGPHVFLVVIRLGRYTEEEKQTVQRIQEIFGQAADRYSMVLFTHGDLLEGTIEDFLEHCSDLQELVDRCNGQYHVFNNKLQDRSQVTELLQKIRKLVQRNGGRHYTNEMLQEAERVVEEEKQRILKEKEEEIRKEEVERKLEEKYEKAMKNMKKQFQAEREREMKERQEEMERERECMNEERKREREEREAERKRDKEEKAAGSSPLFNPNMARNLGPARSLDHEDCGSIMVSSDWTKLNPEVNSNDADKASIYSLQSEAGTFECSVSGLRWICKGKVSFKYQFCSLEEHMESIRSYRYMPASSLMDITVIAGKLDEVHLPHWICIDDNPTILDKFAVLHIDDCGVVVEKVSEVTSSHVKLCEPVFSPRVVLVRFGLSVKINCNVLIYKSNTAFLTLHVYLIPRDPGLQKEMDKREKSYGYKVIRKPHPDRSLKIHDRFILTADLEDAEMNPKDLKLRYESTTPNFFEVYTRNPDRDFELKLNQKKGRQQVWTCTIRKDEYQSTGHKQETDVTRYYPKTAKRRLQNLSKMKFDSFCEELLGRREEPQEDEVEDKLSAGRAIEKQREHFVDEHQCDLIERLSSIKPILDHLLAEGVISQEDYETISAVSTTQEKMRKLLRGPLKAAGQDGKDVFYRILEEKEPYLVADLKKKGL